MMSRYRTVSCLLGKQMQNSMPVMMSPMDQRTAYPESSRHIAKHWNPKFKRERTKKVYKVDLSQERLFPKMDTEIDMFQNLKKRGYLPMLEDPEPTMIFPSLGGVFEQYEPPVGDGKYTGILSKKNIEKVTNVNEARKNFMAIRRVKSNLIDFKTSIFLVTAHDIYLKAHEALASKDYKTLSEYVTESAFVKMTDGLRTKTVVWKFLESLEAPKMVHARVGSLMGDMDNFAQLTVRFHTQQILCVYDRFGRRIQGSEILKKDVLEYVVFERHLSFPHASWRLHAKIFPKAHIGHEPCETTYVLPRKVEKPEEPKKEAKPEEPKKEAKSDEPKKEAKSDESTKEGKSDESTKETKPEEPRKEQRQETPTA